MLRLITNLYYQQIYHTTIAVAERLHRVTIMNSTKGNLPLKMLCLTANPILNLPLYTLYRSTTYPLEPDILLNTFF